MNVKVQQKLCTPEGYERVTSLPLQPSPIHPDYRASYVFSAISGKPHNHADADAGCTHCDVSAPGISLRLAGVSIVPGLQGRKLALPRYDVIAVHGEAHEQEFEVECVIPDLDIRRVGKGHSRRSAEQCAATDAYKLAAGHD